MGRPGRRRSLKKRQPSGQTRRDRKPPNLVAKAKRIRDQAMRNAEEPELGTELGRLFLLRQISPTAYATARHFHHIVGDYRRILDTPKCFPEVPGYCTAGSNGAALPDSVEIFEIKAEFESARACLLKVAPGGRALSAVNHLVIEDKHLLPEQLKLATLGLDCLAANWGLTLKAKTP